MKGAECSLRQVMVLTVTGLLAPAADLLPGLLVQTAGETAWLTPILMLPVVLVWAAVLGRLFREEGSGLFTVMAQRLGRVFGRILISLYIMWGIWLLAEQLRRSGERMSMVYGGRGGGLMAGAVLLLALWMVCGKRGALCRGAELFWLAAVATVLAVVLLSAPQIEPDYLLPGRKGWRGQVQSWTDYLNVWGSTVFGAALLTRVPRRGGMIRRAAGWLVVGCIGAAALTAVVLGQMGPGLTAKLPQPFLVAVQGISLEGALTRLEGPVAALWLLADFCRAGLLLAAFREAGGERGGVWLAAAGAGLAVAARFLLPAVEGAVPGGILLGFLTPFFLWVICCLSVKGKSNATSCGQ